ncbi:MAG: NADH-quinone oxidoreductase subunit J [Pirellulaceae bacterium]|jgi:NADH-quinone oxidoreductase subunit J|nr:NADH-quinone oxidoreductase subunit J [Pirellulaceae bacterium]MDP6722858.1 NADH-quinone oxidoreductase subunit J [Pirellulaceae bacterium]
MILAAMDWHAFFFWMFSLLTCGFAVAVLFSNNVVHMAFYLILSLGASAGLFFLAGAEFVGAMQLMIYVGGTLVLVIFGVMLTAQSRFVSMKPRSGEWVVALGVGGSLLFMLLLTAFNVEDWRTPNPLRATVTVADTQSTSQIGLAFAGVRADKLEQSDERLRGGMSGYLLPFVIVSVHLLVVLIGAAYMARTKRRAGASEVGL